MSSLKNDFARFTIVSLESAPKAGMEKIEMIQAGGGLRVAIRHLLEQRKHSRGEHGTSAS